MTTAPKGSATITFDAKGDGVTFLTEPMKETTEITGPVAAKLHISSSTADADLFLVLRVFTPDMKEVVFQGALTGLLGDDGTEELNSAEARPLELLLCCVSKVRAPRALLPPSPRSISLALLIFVWWSLPR
jgi:hypothetical protein